MFYLDENHYDLFICTILSHGRDHKEFLTSDNKYLDVASNILLPFNNAPKLRNTTKIYFANIVSPEIIDNNDSNSSFILGKRVSSDDIFVNSSFKDILVESEERVNYQINKLFVDSSNINSVISDLPEESIDSLKHSIFAYSILPGVKSFNSAAFGSLFCYHLISIIKSKYKEADLIEMLSLCNSSVAAVCPYQALKCESFGMAGNVSLVPNVSD